MAPSRGTGTTKTISAVFDPGDDVGFVYSHYNNGHRGEPEFLALNVPRSKATMVAGTMNFLTNREVKHGQSVQTREFYFLTNEIKGERKADLSRTHMTATNHRSPFFELVPRFECSSADEWGSRPSAPSGREELVDSILDAWNIQIGSPASFILFVDGNIGNCSLANLKRVDLGVALRHVHDWKVDWDMYLNEEQVAYVREHSRFFSKLAKVLFRSKEVCAGCGLIETGRLMVCQACKMKWYCSVACQRADWPNHKSSCKELQALRNNQPRPPPARPYP
jgi:MYND finger